MVASYRLEAVYIAVNIAEMKYVLLMTESRNIVFTSLRHYCNIRSPVYSIAAIKLCIIALFLKDKVRMMKKFDSVIKPYSILPKASHIVDGLWFVATQQILTFAVVCPNKREALMCIHL